MRHQYLPRPLRYHFFRNELQLPKLVETPGLEFKPAESPEEFLAAFKILHDSYVEFKYMQPSVAGLRVTPYHLLPGTVTLIAKQGQEVVGTVSIIRDNLLGLPMDKVFDLKPLRMSGARIAEVSALAIRKDFRGKKGALLHRIMRYFWKFTMEYLAVDSFVCAVNPAMNELYESIYLFKSLPLAPRVGKYDFVNGAPAVGLVADVEGNYAIWEKRYGKRESENNLFCFMSQPFLKNEFNFSQKYYTIFQNSMTPETRTHLLRDPLTNPMQDLSLEERFKVMCQMNGRQKLELELVKNLIIPRPRDARFEVFCPIPNHTVRVLDASEAGLRLTHKLGAAGKAPDFIPIQIGPTHVARVKTRVCWVNELGFSGHQIVDADSSWLDFISYLQADGVDKGCLRKVVNAQY